MKVNGQLLLLWLLLCVNWVIVQAGHRGKSDQKSRTKFDVKLGRYKPHHYFLHRRINGSLHYSPNGLGSVNKSNKRSFIQRKVHIKGAPKGVIVTLNGQRIDPNTGSTVLPLQPPNPVPPLPGRNVPINVHVHVNKKYNEANIIGQRKQPIIITSPNAAQAMRPIVIPVPMPAQAQAPQPLILPAPLPPPPPAVLPAPIQLPLPAPLPPPPPPVAIPVPVPAPAPPPAKDDSDLAEILQTAALLNTLNKKEESRPKIIPVMQPVISPLVNQGYPAGGNPNQGYPAGGNPNQGYPAGGNPNQGYPAGGNPNQGYPAGGNPNQGYPAGGNPNQGYPAGGNQNQGYPAGGGNQNQGYPAGANQNQATAGTTAAGAKSPLAGLSGILPLLLPFNCRCGCERRCPDLCNLCRDVDEEMFDTLECCKSVPCPCVNAGAGTTQPAGVATAGTAVTPAGGVVTPQPQQGVAQPAPASTVAQMQPTQMSNPATAPIPPAQPAPVPPLTSLGQLSPLPQSQPASAPPLPVLPGAQPPGTAPQPVSALPQPSLGQPASATPLPSLSALPGPQSPGPASQPASAPPLPLLGQPNPVPPLQPVSAPPVPSPPVLPGSQPPVPASQPSGQVPQPLPSIPAPVPAVPPPLPPKPEITPPKPEIAPPKSETQVPGPPGVVVPPKPEIPPPVPPGSVGPPKPESLGKGPNTEAGTSTEAPGKGSPGSESVPPPTDTGSSSSATPGTPGELVAPPPDNSGPIKIPTVAVLPGESAPIGPSEAPGSPVGPGPPVTNPAPPPASTSSTNPSPPLPSLPLMKTAYPAPPPAPQVFIIKENRNPIEDPEESKSAEALDNLSESFENAFKVALKSERRKGRLYDERRRGRVSKNPEEEENLNTEDDETNDKEEEDDEDKVRSHGGSRNDFVDAGKGEDTKINEDIDNDHENDNGDEDDDGDDDDDDTDTEDKSNDYDNDDDDNDNGVDIKADKEPPYDLDQPRHSHSLPYVEGDRHRDKPIRKTKHQSENRKKYSGFQRYDQNRQLRKEGTNRIGLSYDRSVNGIFNRYDDRNDVKSHYHREKFPLFKTVDDEEISREYGRNSFHSENVQEDPLETTRLSRPRNKGAPKFVKKRKQRLKSRHFPREKSHLPTSHDASDFAHFQDSASDKHGGHHEKDDHTFYEKDYDHHYSHSKTEMIPEDEITEDSGSTNEGNDYSGDNEKVIPLKSLENLLTSTQYERGSSHFPVGDTYAKVSKTPFNTVEKFKPRKHKIVSKHNSSKQEKSIAEDATYSSGEESGQNEINDTDDDDDD